MKVKCVKKASSNQDLLLLRLMVPGAGLEAVWAIDPRDLSHFVILQ